MYGKLFLAAILIAAAGVTSSCNFGETAQTPRPLSTSVATEGRTDPDPAVSQAPRATEMASTASGISTEIPEVAEPTLEAHATAAADRMHSQIQEFSEQGLISRTEGALFRLPALESSWAQRDYYDLLLADLVAGDFVLDARLRWETASGTIDRSRSGCGIAFRVNARGDHYLAYLGLDGWHYLYKNLGGALTSLNRQYVGPVDAMVGSANLSLVVEGDAITTVVNGATLDPVLDEDFTRGLIAYAIVSGSNAEPGITCTISNVEVWVIDPG